MEEVVKHIPELDSRYTAHQVIKLFKSPRIILDLSREDTMARAMTSALLFVLRAYKIQPRQLARLVAIPVSVTAAAAAAAASPASAEPGSSSAPVMPSVDMEESWQTAERDHSDADLMKERGFASLLLVHPYFQVPYGTVPDR